MSNSICGAKCNECQTNEMCNGCISKRCFIANYISIGGMEAYMKFKSQIIDEFNGLKIPGMPIVTDLYALNGDFVNLEYTLPNGKAVKYLDDSGIYLGNQLECEFDKSRCFGIIAGMDFLLICTYGENGTNPELLMYKKR